MYQMTWVRLQHCRFTRVNGGASAKVQVRGRSRRFASLLLAQDSQASSTRHDADVCHHPHHSRCIVAPVN